MLRSWVTPQVRISLLEVLLYLLQLLHPVLGLQVDLRFLKMVKMIPHTPKHWFCHQNQFSTMLRSWVRISLLEVLLDLLQPLHPVLGLQVYLRLLKMVPNDFPFPKTCDWTSLYHVQKQSLVRCEISQNMPNIVSHLKLELLSINSLITFIEYSFGTNFRVSQTTFWKEKKMP